jgi:hypothetical protein
MGGVTKAPPPGTPARGLYFLALMQEIDRVQSRWEDDGGGGRDVTDARLLLPHMAEAVRNQEDAVRALVALDRVRDVRRRD